MPTRSVDLRPEDFAAAMPFGFMADERGCLQTVGTALQRRLDLQPGDLVAEHLRVIRPTGGKSFEQLASNPSATVQLRATSTDFEIKGCKVDAGEPGCSAFFGSPVVQNIEEFKSLGLRLGDFAPADAIPDLLLAMQATQAALRDARNLGEELQDALATARAATEAKARFLAVMSHEIRTPLNGFGSMIDLLRGSPLNTEQTELLDTMDRCAHSLLVLVNDILDFSKLEADKVAIERQPMMLNAALTEIVGHFDAIAAERGIELRLRSDFTNDVWVQLDFERVRQVLANLIGNAMKFTTEGCIEVSAQTEGDLLLVDVIDSGVGIPDASKDHLFEPFMQADSSTTREFGGTGLGLTISRQLARAMSGEVELIRSDRDGTHFRFSLLAPTCDGCPTTPSATAPDANETFAGTRVLVAEDDATNQLIARRLLEKLGIETAVANNGVEAILATEQERFDLVLMDLMMPSLDGIEATRRIRASDGPCRDVPIVAFSAAALEADREAAQQAGMTGFLEKPARLAAVRGVLRRYLAPQHAATE